MALNPVQQAALLEILDSVVFRRATEEVITLAEIDISQMLAPESAVAMACEKGTRNAFRLLRRLTIPVAPVAPLLMSSSLRRNRSTDKQTP